MLKSRAIYIAAFVFTLIWMGCAKDSTQAISCDGCGVTGEVSFDANVKSIIDNSCAYSGCHSGSAPGDYTTYEGLKTILDSGLFQDRVLSAKNMPPEYAPDERPKTLSECELCIIQDWVDAGYPDN